MDVPFVDLKAQTAELRDAYEQAFWSVADRAAYTLGPELEEFEAAFAAFCGAEHCVGVSSGTDAVKLALLGAGVGPGDEVVVPANTFIATVEPVSHIGAVPVFCDCDPETALLDPDALAAVCEEREGMLSAVVPVHLYGRPCDMTAITAVAEEYGLAVVEDACQAHGARYGLAADGSGGRSCGSMGVTAAFSFYPGKNLGALGDGGAVVTSDNAVAERLRLLRNHGQAEKQVHSVVGYCDRLHNLQAAFLTRKLERLPRWNEARRAAAARYDELLREVPGVQPVAVGWSDDSAGGPFSAGGGAEAGAGARGAGSAGARSAGSAGAEGAGPAGARGAGSAGAEDSGLAGGVSPTLARDGIRIEPVYHLYVVRLLGGDDEEDVTTDLAERLLAEELAMEGERMADGVDPLSSGPAGTGDVDPLWGDLEMAPDGGGIPGVESRGMPDLRGRGLSDIQARGRRRDEVRERLGAAGVQSGVHYAVPLHLQPAYAHLGYRLGDFPAAESLAPRILSLPMFPEITDEQIEYVVARLAEAVAAIC